jgi:thiamine biosynthesis protein ThiS
MRISLNGEKTDSGGAKTIDDLVRGLQVAPATVLIEHNGVALHRREWPQRQLAEGDQIEIVRVVAGG